MQKAYPANSTGVVPLSRKASGQHKENGKDIQKSQGWSSGKTPRPSRTKLLPSGFPLPWRKSPPVPTQHQGESIQLLLLCKHNIEQNAHSLLTEDRRCSLFSHLAVHALQPMTASCLSPSCSITHPTHCPAVTAEVKHCCEHRHRASLNNVTQALLLSCTSIHISSSLQELKVNLPHRPAAGRYRRSSTDIFFLVCGCKVL